MNPDGRTATTRPKGKRYLLEEQPECKHTKRPEGFLAFQEWAEKKAKTHDQTRCPVCGLWAVWVPKKVST